MDSVIASSTPFVEMPKIPRLHRPVVVTEKIDGTNASVYIPEDGGPTLFGSRTRWITPGKHTDNHGFARWATEHEAELRLLGPGQHFGEWWGQGIQRGYGLAEKRFSLFNVGRWTQPDVVLPACVGLVPVLYEGDFDTTLINAVLYRLADAGSAAAPGYFQPEGIVVFHKASKMVFKQTLGDDGNKGTK